MDDGFHELHGGGPEDDIICVFGGSKFDGQHWVMITKHDNEMAKELWSGSTKKGTLREVWKRANPRIEEIPEWLVESNLMDTAGGDSGSAEGAEETQQQ